MMKKIIFLSLLFCSVFALSQKDKGIYSKENFNDNWRFERFGMHQIKPGITVNEPEGLEKIEFKDKKWRKLNLPHDWGVEGPFRDDLEHNTGLLPWKGIGWYRKYFQIHDTDKGQQIFIDFDGAMANAKVWVNGAFVGTWPYGYSSFRFNITPYLKFGEKNVIAVRLDTETLDSRWYPGAGIYRNVWLTKMNPAYIDHWGIYLTTPSISKEKGIIDLQVKLKNTEIKTSEVSVQTVILDAGGNQVSESKSISTVLPALAGHELRFDIEVKNPSFWNIETPYLYKAVTRIYKNEKLIQEEQTNFGFRTLEFSAESGFLLNGKKIEIKGVCNHQDLGPIGIAFNTRAAERQLELLKEMGCNAIRTSHNPPAPELLDLCDKMGFLVQVEAFDAWRKGKKKNDYNIYFDEWHVQDLKAMINRDKNHPCVFMWSIGNEVPDQNNPELAKRLAQIVKITDPTRPVTAGCNMSFAGFNGFQNALDVFGYNYNHNSYKKFLTDSANTHLPFIANETSSCVSSRGEYFFPVVEGKARENLPGNGVFYLSSYDQQFPGWGLIPDRQFELNDKYARIIGEFVWTGFDYLGEPTPFNKDVTNLLNYTDSTKIAKLKNYLDKIGSQEISSRSSYFGILDLCGFKKDRFYIYQAKWRPEFPMAHILPHWNWPERKGQNVPVHVYTSGNEAELFLNGKSLGKRKKGTYEYRLRWDDVIYEAGELKVIVWKDGKKWAEDVMKTTSEAAKINLTADRKNIRSDGTDLTFITIDVVDENDLLIPRSKTELTFKLDGPGEIIGIGNGDQTNHESFTGNKHHTFNGKCLVIIRSKKTAGIITLNVESKGLKGNNITIQTTSI